MNASPLAGDGKSRLVKASRELNPWIKRESPITEGLQS